MMQMWRRLELVADRLAAPKMAVAGWDPAALMCYIERVQAPDDAQRETWLALPPHGSDRSGGWGEFARAYGPHEELDKAQIELRHLTGPTKAPPSLGR